MPQLQRAWRCTLWAGNYSAGRCFHRRAFWYMTSPSRAARTTRSCTAVTPPSRRAGRRRGSLRPRVFLVRPAPKACARARPARSATPPRSALSLLLCLLATKTNKQTPLIAASLLMLIIVVAVMFGAGSSSSPAAPQTGLNTGVTARAPRRRSARRRPLPAQLRALLLLALRPPRRRTRCAAPARGPGRRGTTTPSLAEGASSLRSASALFSPRLGFATSRRGGAGFFEP